MGTKEFILALARGARGKDAAKALILPQIFGGTGYVNAGIELTVTGTPPLSLPNSLGKPLKALEVALSPYQEGTGDPSPDNVRAIHGTDKLNMFVEESYDQSATPKAVLTLPQTVYTGTIGSEGGESRDVSVIYNGTNLGWYAGFGGYVTSQKLITDYNNPDAVPNVLCDIYPVMSYAQATQSERAMSVVYGGEGYAYNGLLFVRDTTVSSLSEFIAQLTGHQIVYRSTPVQFPITAPTIPTPTGTATTWATAEDGTVESMSVTYIGKASS